VAIEQDPKYALAYVGVGDVYNIIAFYSGLPPIQARDKSRSALQKALTIDSNLAEAQASYAYSRMLYEWDFSGADQAFKRALQLNPNQVTGHYWYALFLTAMERHGEALEHIHVALGLDPLSLVINSHKGWILYFSRRYEAAIEQLLSAIEMDHGFALARYFLGLVYLRTGQLDQSIQHFIKAQEATNNHPAAIAGLASAHALSGNKAQARKILRTLEELSQRRYVAPYYIALVHIGLSEKEKAFEMLERAFDEQSSYFSNLRADPALDALRSDPRFDKLIARVGLPRS
jgi:tetratricopeptide (TPR) repeat protein